MNNTRIETKAIIEDLKPVAEKANCGVVIGVPFNKSETAVNLLLEQICCCRTKLSFEKSGLH